MHIFKGISFKEGFDDGIIAARSADDFSDSVFDEEVGYAIGYLYETLRAKAERDVEKE